MAAYYSKGGDESGGFMPGGGSQQASQGEGRRNYDNESLRPVTIKQMIDADEPYPGASFSIDNTTVTQVTMVGQVLSVKPYPTNVTYLVDDGTGQIEVKSWDNSINKGADDDDAMDGGSNRPVIEPNQHIRVWGRLKSLNEKRHVLSHHLRAVEDFNEVNYHLLESTYVHLYMTKGGAPGAQKDGAGGGDGMFVDGATGYDAGAGSGMSGDQSAKLAACGPLGHKVFNFINNAPGGNEGVHLNVIATGAGVSVQDVLRASDELLGQGLIYTTIDDETWAILDFQY